MQIYTLRHPSVQQALRNSYFAYAPNFNCGLLG